MVFFFCLVSDFSLLKTLDTFIACWVIWVIHNPPNSGVQHEKQEAFVQRMQILMMMITFILRYSPLLDMWFLSMQSHVILSTWVTNFFIEHFWISTKVVKLQRWHGWCHMKLLPSQCILCTPYNHAPCCLMQSHICKVYACLAATCHLHFWQNDWDLLRATAVTQGWNR